MNNSESAKKGFKTFILTLSISLMVFSAVYYILSSYGTDTGMSGVQDNEVANAMITEKKESPGVQGAKDEKTVFGEIVNKKPLDKTLEVQAVLAGATSAPETTQSTTAVPGTGYTEMTIGLILSLILFIGAMIYNLMNPRKMALSKFERDALGKSN
jgi:hypothetical protein